MSENFIKPYQQPSIGEDEGLSSEDLAKSLNTTHNDIMSVLANSKFETYAKSEGLNFTIIIVKNNSRGRPRKVAIMDTECARVFAARYGSLEGFRYALWLVRLEMRLIPKLYSKIAALEARLARRLNHTREGMIQVPKYQEDLFGHMILSHFETVQKEMVSRLESLEAKIIHNSKVTAGLSKSTEEALIEVGKERREKEAAIVKIVKDK